MTIFIIHLVLSIRKMLIHVIDPIVLGQGLRGKNATDDEHQRKADAASIARVIGQKLA